MIKSNYKLRVVLISNNSYGQGLDNFEGVNHTVEQIYNSFKNCVTDSEKDILHLKDINHTNAVNDLYSFIDSSGSYEDCIFLFYFCGHGKIAYNKTPELILALKDTSAHNFDEVGISFSKITDRVKRNRIKHSIYIIDSCCSGLVENVAMGNEKPQIIDEKNMADGSVYISSVKGTSPSFETLVGEQKAPWFSYCFNKVIMDNSKNNSSIKEIFNNVCQLVMERDDLGMEPQIFCKNFLVDNNIFFYENEAKQSIQSPLDVIDWRITTECDNACPVCYACNDTKYEELSEDQIDIIIEKLTKHTCKSICISGGEPTKSKNFDTIMQKLYKNGFSIFLSTNGYKYMDFKDEIEQYIEKLSLPLDGYDEESNKANGRNENSFQTVKKILDFYQKNTHCFPIKVSTVLSKKTCNEEYIEKMSEFLKKYNISIWKIYEFIPENRGKNYKRQFTATAQKIRSVQDWIKKNKSNFNFKIELVRRESRDSAYFIIQPNGDVIIPVDEQGKGVVNEQKLGNILDNDFDTIIEKWNSIVRKENYFSNIKSRKLRQTHLLKPSDKLLLYNIISGEQPSSLKQLSEVLLEPTKALEEQISSLYEHRIIKKIIPIVNLNRFGIKTFLATLHFSKYIDFPEDYLEDYLCYNAFIGWVTKCENNTFRIAIFAKEQMAARNILDKIRNDLNDGLEYEIHDLRCSYSIGEERLFSNQEGNNQYEDISKYNSSEPINDDNIKLTSEEFYTLKQIETLRKPLKENINQKMFFKSFTGINDYIASLQEKGIVEQLSVILDTRLLGYSWYIIFVKILDSQISDFIEYLTKNFNNITHINSLVPNTSQWNLDFEVHVSSLAEVNKVREQIEQAFVGIETNPPLKIIKECKFSFLTHSVSDLILNNYVIEE